MAARGSTSGSTGDRRSTASGITAGSAPERQLRFDRTENEAQVHIALPGLSYFLSAAGLPKRLFELLPMRWKREEHGGYERQIGVRFNDGAVWVDLWSDPMDWRSSDPKWMQFSVHLDDLLFGKTKYSTRTLEERAIKIAMPEGTYDATAKREASSWLRPRWPWSPFSKRRTTVKIEIPGGIGIPGKGENSWDCGDDALFGMSCSADTIEEAIGKVIASALKTRRRYGWTEPAQVQP
jgi:hypothetical protein